MEQIIFRQIGIIHTPYLDATTTPIQAIRSSALGTVEVFDEYLEGLLGLDEFSHIYLFYTWHKAGSSNSLTVTPFLDNKEHGVFATRFPSRPNPLGFSVVQLLKIERNILTIQGVDMLDDTPLVDIKPYVPDFDHFEPTEIGWYGKRAYK